MGEEGSGVGEKETCCFTGHRAIAPEDRVPLQTALRAEIRALCERG